MSNVDVTKNEHFNLIKWIANDINEPEPKRWTDRIGMLLGSTDYRLAAQLKLNWFRVLCAPARMERTWSSRRMNENCQYFLIFVVTKQTKWPKIHTNKVMNFPFVSNTKRKETKNAKLNFIYSWKYVNNELFGVLSYHYCKFGTWDSLYQVPIKINVSDSTRLLWRYRCIAIRWYFSSSFFFKLIEEKS